MIIVVCLSVPGKQMNDMCLSEPGFLSEGQKEDYIN